MKFIHRIWSFLRRNILINIILLIFLISFVSALVFYAIEAKYNPNLHSLREAIWWVLISITTVGYGDVVPVTTAGRLLGIFIIFTGIALVSVFTATVSSIFVAQKLKEDRGLKSITATNHIIICGWNHTVEQILNVIFGESHPPAVVLINQLPEDQIQSLLLRFKETSLDFVRGDFAQEEILNRANISKARTVLVLPDASLGLATRNDEKTILTCFSVKAIQPKIKVYAHILDRDNEPYLKKAQVDEYIISDDFTGVLMGEMISQPGVPQTVQNLIGKSSKSHFERVVVPDTLAGKTFGDAMQYFRKMNKLPIALVQEQKPLSFSSILSEDYSYLDEFIERKFREAGRSLRKGEQVDVRLNPPDDTPLEKEMFLVLIK